jgi:Arm DNA-binding domain
MDHVSTRITKRMVQQATPSSRRYIIWDRELKGFGIRIESTGTKCYLVRYRPKGIAGAPKRFITIGRHGPVTAEQARTRALSILGSVASGHDPAGSERAAPLRS